MDIEAGGYNGVVGDSDSNLEVELTSNGIKTLHSAELISVEGTNYTYEVNGLEAETTYQLTSINYTTDQYNYSEIIESTEFTTTEYVVQETEIFSILLISLIALIILILLIIIIVMIKYLSDKKLHSLEEMQAKEEELNQII